MEPNMTMLRHNGLRELLGVYALDLTDADETAAIEAHLPTCTECRAELSELRAAVGALPLLTAPLEPPPALRSRVEAAILAEPPTAAGSPAPVPLPQRPATPTNVITPPPSFWSRGKPWAAVAAILLLVSLGLLAWNLQLRRQIAALPTPEVIALAPSDAAPNAGGEVRYDPTARLFMLDVHDLPALPAGEVYQVWLIGDAGPVPVGVFSSPTDRYAVIADRNRYQTVAITNEPGPLGSPGPTGDILVSAPL
ncbi:MAG: anti-sigma factor [Thermomicrobiales bacterium]